MFFSISAIHSLAILATADHEPTCVEIGFQKSYRSYRIPPKNIYFYIADLLWRKKVKTTKI